MFLVVVTLAPAYVLTFSRLFKSSFNLHRTMEKLPVKTSSNDIEHPDDAQYIWLPIVVLVGVILLSGLVYVMSRRRGPLNCLCFKRRNATRNGYVNVDEEESDVSMVGANEFDEPNFISSLLEARLHIAPRIDSYPNVHIDADDIALRV